MSSFDFISNRFILSDNPAENEYLISYYAPKLIWLAKDINLPLVNGVQLSSDKYFHNCLYSHEDPESTFARNFIVNTFKDRFFVPFPPNNSTVNFNDSLQKMSSQFIDNIKLIKEKIYSKGSIKYFDGISLTSRMMVHFITCITELFNKKSVVNYYEVSFNQSQRYS
jgi:hypothetical protein